MLEAFVQEQVAIPRSVPSSVLRLAGAQEWGETVRELLQLVLKVSLIVFMLGSLGAMGLELALDKAMAALRNLRFLVLTVLLGFLICPALAYITAKALSLQPPHAMGLLLLGMAPAAPFMPLVVARATAGAGMSRVGRWRGHEQKPRVQGESVSISP